MDMCEQITCESRVVDQWEERDKMRRGGEQNFIRFTITLYKF